MPAVGNTERATRVDDEYGGSTTVWAPINTGVRFRVMPGPTGADNLDAALVNRLGTRVAYQVTLEADLNIDSGDRIQQTFPTEQAFEILLVSNKDVSWQTAIRLLVAEFL
jgi:hypothetical protein